MEELGFFNEREAECFEREDTLSLSDLEKLNVNEDLPEMERAEQLLKTGLDKQKISVLSSLPKILASNNTKSNLVLILDCMKVAWQKCESETNANSAVLQEIFKGITSLACATVDGKVLSFPTASFHHEYTQRIESCREEKKNAVFLLSDEQVAKLLVPLALDMVSEIQQKDYAEDASLAVIASLSRLGGSLKKTQARNMYKVLRVAIDKGDVSQPPGSRLICCLLLGAVTAQKLLTSQDIEGLFFQKEPLMQMMALCQDTDAEVRKRLYYCAFSEEKACSELLPELLELLQDEEEQVKQTAFLALLSLLDFFPAAERIKRVIPEFLNVVESHPDYLVRLLAEQYGDLATKLATLNHLGSDNAPAFLQGYAKLCIKDDIQLRQYCAYNFPAIVKAFGGSYMPLLMDDLLVKLSNDPAEKIRYHVAAGIHEVVLLLGQQRAQRYLKPLVITLLKDESASVQGMAISRAPQIMSSMFGPGDDDAKATVLDAVIKSIIQFHSIVPASRNRELVAFVETLQCFPLFCSSLQMYEMVIPIIFDLIEEGARPVQLLAMQALIRCIRKNDVSSHRYSLLSKIRNEYGHSKSYWRRILYLDACVFALEVNSRQYCRLNFLDIAIDLLEDPIPNVRLKAATVVPQWKDVLTYLSDDKMLERIRQFLKDATAADTDRDVANAIMDAKTAIELSDIGQRRPQEDLDDKRRVSEEENLGLVSDHEDSSADSKWSSMLEYTLVVGKDGQVVRRARVKSLDLVNKLTRSQGKESGRGAASSNGGMGSVGSNALTIGMPVKPDPNRGKTAPKTPNKPSPPLTTLPNCAPVRPPNVKIPQGIKVMGSTGKLTSTTSSKAAAASIRSGTGLPKDTGTMTKIPIIRPSAPAKRENSPSTGTKPGSSGTIGTNSISSSSSVGTLQAQGYSTHNDKTVKRQQP
uniref:TOG domain-containing protein n=1 Tax=Globisporangium ultimum (strain ATCC 200006 / CBS 805.95 / DAOM BR144) TaxID=431595 RepID=K3WPS6_GLOUD